MIRDLKLNEHGLRIVNRRAQNFLPMPDGRYLLTGEGRTEREIAKFSVRDAARYSDYQVEISRVADVLRSLVLGAPPNLVLRSFSQLVRELGKLAAIGKRLWQVEGLKAAFQLFRKSAGDMLDDWFDSDPIKAVLGFDAVVGNLASPYTPGSAYVLLHHVFGEANGKPGSWGHAIGGMGAITQAMARAAGEHGVRIDVRSPVGGAHEGAGRRRVRTGDSVGGVFEVVAHNVPPGLGTYANWDERLDAQLAAAVMSLQAVKAVEIGDAVQAATSLGSEVHDEIGYESGALIRSPDLPGVRTTPAASRVAFRTGRTFACAAI